MEEKEKKCNCNENCDCGCNDGLECKCEDNCNGEECNCNHDCECSDCSCEDNCDNDCHCDECNCEDDCDEKKIKELEEKIKELETKSLASQADMINYRKRKDEEVAKMMKYANEDLASELLQTIDNFERAIKMDDDNLDDEVSKFLEGFKMIYCNLVSTLEKYDVKAIDGSNKEFDPTYHQAVMTEHVDGTEPGMVIEVLQKGYLLKDKVIRPAMVKVSE